MTEEELIKEAEEYANDNSYRYANDFITCQEAYLAGAKLREERIAELEKENAELKDDNKVMADNYSKMEQKFYDKFTEAKEIIKELLKALDGRSGFDEDVFGRAEQFLKEK